MVDDIAESALDDWVPDIFMCLMGWLIVWFFRIPIWALVIFAVLVFAIWFGLDYCVQPGVLDDIDYDNQSELRERVTYFATYVFVVCYEICFVVLWFLLFPVFWLVALIF